MSGVSGKVAIIGAGQTRFGEHFDMGYNDMVVEACYQAFEQARVEPKQIEAAYFGTYMPYGWGYEGLSGSTVTEALGLKNIPVTRVVNFCASGMDAIRNAALSIAAGEYDTVLAFGAEKMREVPPRGSLVAQHVEKGHPLWCKGRTAPGMFALIASRYFKEYGIDELTLAKVAVKNHKHGKLNPNAHIRKEITIEQALNAPPICNPLKLLDCCPTTDGAAAVVLTRAELAPSMVDDYVLIRGMGLSSDSGYWNAQTDPSFKFTGFPSTQNAALRAYAQAGIIAPMDELDVIELHDCFTITEIVNYEDLHLVPKGSGWKLIEEGETYNGGRIPVNTDGGLKACGHPIGASGVRMVKHVADQILGRAGEMQVKGAKLGLAHTLGGPGAVACVIILGAP